MWLVFCEAKDRSALWVARGLEGRGLKPLEIVTPEALAYNRRFVHSIVASHPSVTLELADGRELHSAAVSGTLNRLQGVPLDHLRAANAADRRYAEQELYALFLSWLYSLPGPLLNKPTPQGLGGAWRHPSEWAWLAARAGLLPLPYRHSKVGSEPLPMLSRAAKRTVIVVKETCLGAVAPSSVLEGCVRLARASGTSLLGVDFQETATGQWLFTDATPRPELRPGGETLLDTLCEVLQP